MLGGELGVRLVEVELLARCLEPPPNHPGDRTRSGHALTPAGVVILAAMHVAHQLEHVTITVGEVRHQPFAEEIAHLERQAQRHITGASITEVGTPASDNWRNASSRRAGVAARGSITRASFGSSVVTDSATFARLRLAMRARMLISRVTSADFVTMPTGWPKRSSTSRMRRIT